MIPLGEGAGYSETGKESGVADGKIEIIQLKILGQFGAEYAIVGCICSLLTKQLNHDPTGRALGACKSGLRKSIC